MLQHTSTRLHIYTHTHTQRISQTVIAQFKIYYITTIECFNNSLATLQQEL